MANPKLIVEVAGDSRKLTRTLKQTETQTQAWARKLGTITGSSTLGGVGSKGLAFGVLGAAGAAALKSTIDAAANSQQVLGQTKVALQDTGLSWEKYGQQIETVIDSQRRLGFDDEELLKTFATFVRGNGDVNKSLELNALSADVARARFIDLASASNIVLKASLGQAGALRRVGIDARNGASATELLTLLTQKYGGAAKAASKDATTSNERFQTSLQNVQEQLGSGLLPVVASLTDALAESTDEATNLVKELQKINVPGLGNASGLNFGKAFKVGLLAVPGVQVIAGESFLVRKLGLGKEDSAKAGAESGKFFGKSFGFASIAEARKISAAATPVATGVSASQRNQWFDAAIARKIDRNQDISTIQGQIRGLEAIAAEIERRIAVTKDITRKLTLEDELVQVNRQRKSLVLQLAEQQADDARKAREKAMAARKDLEETANAVKLGVAAAAAAFKEATDKTGPLTKATQLSSDRILSGLNLARDDERTIRARLSHFDSNASALSGSGSGSMTVQVNSTTVVDGKVIAKSTSKQQARVRKVNTSQRNGPLAGRTRGGI